MNAEVEAQKAKNGSMNTVPSAAPKPSNPSAVRKAIALGKDMRKQPDTSKADVARKMFEAISDEPREVIVQAFVDGAGLTQRAPKLISLSQAPSREGGRKPVLILAHPLD